MQEVSDDECEKPFVKEGAFRRREQVKPSMASNLFLNVALSYCKTGWSLLVSSFTLNPRLVVSIHGSKNYRG